METTPTAHAANDKIKNAIALLGKGSRSVREMRTLIMGLEAAMQAMPEYVAGKDFDTRHHFSPGIYTREAHIPKGFVVTGKIHSTEHLNILSHGKITVWTEDGMKTLSASTIIKSKPGIKRVGYAHEDSVWITVHKNPTDERDIKKIEARLFHDTFESAYLASNRTFEDAVQLLGFTPEEVTAFSEGQADRIPFPAEPGSIRIGDSSIHGKGMFATRKIENGELIAPSRIKGKRTPAGRYCNHSGSPNVSMVMRENGDVDMIAIKDINPGEELLNDYYLSFENTRVLINGGTQLCQHS